MKPSERFKRSRDLFSRDIKGRELQKALQCRGRGCRIRIASVTVGDEGPRLLLVGSDDHFEDPEGGLGFKLRGRPRLGVGGTTTVPIDGKSVYIECRCGHMNRLDGPGLLSVAAPLYDGHSGQKAADE